MTDRLVKKAQKGDKEALLKLILNKQDEYYRIALSYMKNKDDALDVMEDMIVILYEKIHTLKKRESFYSWSKTILVRCCYDTFRKRKKTEFLEEEELVAQDDEIESAEIQIDLDQMLAQLNPQQAEMIRLKYLHDLDLKTIGAITNTSLGTVKSRIYYGLKKLYQLYRGEQDE
ncbi:RNA polymerase sigma-70 factor, ECF subfamily [Gracilibacillus ureilyticus]|uniref:RNA polymerase sigma-70 factor, ECF subfamily n=1 Tax=Gracilibacillus ureilyticus TaxID=531814 RepID=A0A1H9U9M9_9BACI|nr:sigma-70 family RNA polymerase sigma factor [Gracilibacillus ureilyticus]SES05938.1 RNA polymerase sigma-70 factor, ECF subfamily [Gracilibacillus ureilyticus]